MYFLYYKQFDRNPFVSTVVFYPDLYNKVPVGFSCSIFLSYPPKIPTWEMGKVVIMTKKLNFTTKNLFLCMNFESLKV